MSQRILSLEFYFSKIKRQNHMSHPNFDEHSFKFKQLIHLFAFYKIIEKAKILFVFMKV